MTTEFALSAVFSSVAHSHAMAGLFGDAVLAIAPMVAAMGDVAALTELGQAAAIFFGLLISTFAAVAFNYKRAFDVVKSYPGVRNVTPTSRRSSAWAVAL